MGEITIRNVLIFDGFPYGSINKTHELLLLQQGDARRKQDEQPIRLISWRQQ